MNNNLHNLFETFKKKQPLTEDQKRDHKRIYQLKYQQKKQKTDAYFLILDKFALFNADEQLALIDDMIEYYKTTQLSG